MCNLYCRRDDKEYGQGNVYRASARTKYTCNALNDYYYTRRGLSIIIILKMILFTISYLRFVTSVQYMDIIVYQRIKYEKHVYYHFMVPKSHVYIFFILLTYQIHVFLMKSNNDARRLPCGVVAVAIHLSSISIPI